MTCFRTIQQDFLHTRLKQVAVTWLDHQTLISKNWLHLMKIRFKETLTQDSRINVLCFRKSSQFWSSEKGCSITGLVIPDIFKESAALLFKRKMFNVQLLITWLLSSYTQLTVFYYLQIFMTTCFNPYMIIFRSCHLAYRNNLNYKYHVLASKNRIIDTG
jgi:hypothetical protein